MYSKVICETTRKIVKLTTKTSYKTSFITGSCKNDTKICVEYRKLKKKAKQKSKRKQLNPEILCMFQNLFNNIARLQEIQFSYIKKLKIEKVTYYRYSILRDIG